MSKKGQSIASVIARRWQYSMFYQDRLYPMRYTVDSGENVLNSKSYAAAWIKSSLPEALGFVQSKIQSTLGEPKPEKFVWDDVVLEELMYRSGDNFHVKFGLFLVGDRYCCEYIIRTNFNIDSLSNGLDSASVALYNTESLRKSKHALPIINVALRSATHRLGISLLLDASAAGGYKYTTGNYTANGYSAGVSAQNRGRFGNVTGYLSPPAIGENLPMLSIHLPTALAYLSTALTIFEAEAAVIQDVCDQWGVFGGDIPQIASNDDGNVMLNYLNDVYTQWVGHGGVDLICYFSLGYFTHRHLAFLANEESGRHMVTFFNRGNTINSLCASAHAALREYLAYLHHDFLTSEAAG